MLRLRTMQMREWNLSSKRRRSVGVVELPKGVHRVVSRGKEYYYWHPGRGTQNPGERIRLPNDPTDPGFWVELRAAQGVTSKQPEIVTVAAVVDLYETSSKFLKLAEGSKEQYRRQFKLLRAGLGTTAAEKIKPSHIRRIVEGMADTPSAANNFLRAMRALSSWGVVHDHFAMSITDGVEPFETDGGHMPWTDEQIAAAHEHLTGAMRRGILLGLYTGQRGSDIVRMGWTTLDRSGFRVKQKKTGVWVYCPVVDELAAEMATWEKAPGPFVRQESGKPYTRKLFSKHFAEVRDNIPALAGVTIHGLRSTAVVRLRRAGLKTAQIQDVVGLSLSMIERYSRFADQEESAQAALIALAEHRKRKQEQNTNL
jgi:hypothetical protein